MLVAGTGQNSGRHWLLLLAEIDQNQMQECLTLLAEIVQSQTLHWVMLLVGSAQSQSLSWVLHQMLVQLRTEGLLDQRQGQQLNALGQPLVWTHLLAACQSQMMMRFLWQSNTGILHHDYQSCMPP